MAAVGRPIGRRHQDDVRYDCRKTDSGKAYKWRMVARPKFYVYELTDPDGSLAYVGKGSGRRVIVQSRRYSFVGKIVKEFTSESAAYKYERELIAEKRPTLNKHPGGNGCRATKTRRQAWEILMDKIGTRAYAARLLLALGVAHPSTVEQLRRVAYG